MLLHLETIITCIYMPDNVKYSVSHKFWDNHSKINTIIEIIIKLYEVITITTINNDT